MDDREVLVRTLFLECGSTQNMEDIIAVAWVIRNRVEKGGWFGSGYAGVCLKPKQFSCFNDITPEQVSIGATLAWKMCIVVAEYVMAARAEWNPLPGVCYYANLKLCNPSWKDKMVERFYDPHLDHTFFKG